MARYIDLEEFAKRITENIKPDAPEEKELIEWCKDECIRQGYAMPTANVVEVVRCGQCKHWKINPNNLYGGYCRYCDGASIDHYCSYGERKK